jgi:protein phosphatase
VETIEAGLQNDGAVDDSRLVDLLKAANEAVYSKSHNDPTLRGMGTTCTLLYVDDTHGRVAHIGDSRLYRLRAGHLDQLSQDHTLVGQMVREGRLSNEEARHHPQRSVITRALGLETDIDVDFFDTELDEGDVMLICSDGLSGMVDDDVIADVLETERDPQVAAERLVDLANEAGGEDNITVIVVSTRPDAETSSPQPEGGGGAAARGSTDRAGTSARAGETSATPAVAPATTGAEPDEPPPPPDTTSRQEDEDDLAYSSSERSWPKRLTVGLVILVIVVAGALFGIRFWLNNSYYIGVTASGAVAIYQGTEGEVAGFDLSTVEETTSLTLSKLPENLRSNVREGITADSLTDAHSKLDNLRQRAREYQQAKAGSKINKKKRSRNKP